MRGYARGAGVSLVLIGAAGLAGWLDFIEPTGDLLHLATGALLAYASFGWRSAEATRAVVVVVVGSLYLLVGMPGPLTALLDELPIGLYRNGEDVAHVALGLLSVFAAILLPNEDGPSADGSSPGTRGAAPEPLERKPSRMILPTTRFRRRTRGADGTPGKAAWLRAAASLRQREDA